MTTVRLRDIEVGYAAAGAGRPVVMIHGLGQDGRSFADVQASLPGYRSFALDLRGHGKSTLGTAEGTLEQLGGDLIAFLEEVTGPAACLGYSLGGTVVLWAAAERPDLITQAVVAGTSTVVGRAAVGFFEERIQMVGGDRAAFAQALQDDTAKQVVAPGTDVAALTAERMEAIGDGGGYINAARAMAAMQGSPLTPRLAEIRCPVDVIGGENDMFCPRKAADIILEALPDATYHEIEGAGHLMSIDRPEAYAAAIMEALARRETDG
jgi:pimeloyl-ACP methyl ester carboxylesterase